MIKSKILLIIFAVSLVSCSNKSSVCTDTQTLGLTLSFSQINKKDTVNFTGIILLNISDSSGSAKINDTLSYNFNYLPLIKIPIDNNTNTLSLQMDFLHVDTSNYATYKKQDTLKFKYNSELILDDLDCGFYFKHNITDTLFSRNEIDSVAFKSENIDNDKNTNIEIYF